MAIHQLIVSVLARARGDRAVAVAARYAGEILRDRRTGILYDGSAEADVVYREIMGPVPGTESAWWRDRETLWNTAEQHELRNNSRVARDWLVGLPHELTAEARIELARTWGDFIATRYAVAVDLSVQPNTVALPSFTSHRCAIIGNSHLDQDTAVRPLP